MLTKLRIQNFKAWKDTGELRLSPLTIFFGTNSSGKSSIGQFLMMLKQTANSSDRNRVLHPGDEKTPVDLGTYEDLLYHHDPESEIKFSLEWEGGEKLKIRDVLTNEKFVGQRIRFEATIGFECHKGLKAVCQRFRYDFCGQDDSEFSAAMVPDDQPGDYRLETEGFHAVRKTGRSSSLPHPTRFYGFPDEINAYYQNGERLNDLAFRFQSSLRRLSYLGPVREEPTRRYAWAGDTPADVGKRGERWVSAFLAAADRKISGGSNQPEIEFDEYVAAWMKRIGLIHSFSISPVAKGLRDYRVRVKITPWSSEVSIPDVGFGVSQLIPVIVQSFYAPEHSTVIIEQPDLHLHPAVQQNLVDLFIDAIKSRENGSDRNVQFILESHSEHLLRRLQRRVAEGKIAKDDVAVYFCEGGENGSRANPLQVDRFGNILNWPKNFFGDQMGDIAEKQKAAIRTRRGLSERK